MSKTWHPVECMTDTNNIEITLCSDGDVVIRKRVYNSDVVKGQKVFNVGKTYVSAYKKLIYAINELEDK